MSDSSSYRRFADYFAVCGLDASEGLEPHQAEDETVLGVPPLKLCYKPAILDQYPDSRPGIPFDEHGVKMLCMPKGMRFVKNGFPRPKFHSFLLTREDGNKSYGCAINFYEQVTSQGICDAMAMLSSMFDTQHGEEDGTHVDAAEIESWTYDPTSDTLYVQKSICIIMEQFFIQAARAWLNHLLSIAFNESDMVLPVESHIYHLLYEVPIPPPGRMLRFSCGGTPITVQMPHINELPLFDFSYKELFLILGSENIVDLFTCMLLEHQILMLSSDLNKFMLIAEGMITLLFPLLWQHVYVPILPKALLHFLDAPVPFIMGLYYETEEERCSFNIPQEGSLCLLDIDNNIIELPEELPLLPGRDELIDELQLLIAKFSIQSRKGSVHLRQGTPEDSTTHGGDMNEGTVNRGRNSSPRSHRSSSASPHRNRRKSADNRRDVAFGDKSKSRSSVNMDSLLISDNGNDAQNDTSETHANNNDTENGQHVINPRLTAMKAIVEKAGLTPDHKQSKRNVNNVPSKTISLSKEDLFVYSKRAMQVSRKQQHENEFNISVREIFVGRFTQLLVDYESFVILPKQEQQQWIMNREQMQNFDKAAFLSDQATVALPFLTLFVETQGFASLIDMKIMALWEDSSPRLSFFDKRVDRLKVQLGIIRSPVYELCTTVQASVDAYLNRSNHVDHSSSGPTEPKYDLTRELSRKAFPKLQANLLAISGDATRKTSKINWRRGDRKRRPDKPEGQKIKDKLAVKVKQYMQESNVLLSDASGDVTQKAQNAFAERLLKECKLKTTRLVVLKLGQEAVELGHGDQNATGIEGNTLVASLCDLLERVWCHGVQLRQLELGNKGSTKSKLVLRMRQSKSALWSHLLAYQKRVKELLADEYGLSNLEVPGEDLKRILVEKSQRLLGANSMGELKREVRRSSMDPNVEIAAMRKVSNDLTPEVIKSRGRRSAETVAELEKARKVEMCHAPSFSPRMARSPMQATAANPRLDLAKAYELLAKADLLIDLKTIQSMPEIKTDTGSARAWTRLALEKKVLASQLKLLLSDSEILTTRYKEYAFVRSDERMEQFLYHLLGLNAVDFFCYTDGFLKSKTTYKVNIAVGKVFGVTTTANTWMVLSGSHMDTGVVNMPKNETVFRFQHTNLGILTALRIGHDNAGISPSLYIDHVTVLNECTGLLYWFPCGRWLSRSDDDGSTERLLVAQMVKERDENNRLLAKLPKSREMSPVQGKISAVGRRISVASRRGPTTSEIQERMADAVNSLVKYFYKEIDDNLTYLLCGENGICQALEMVFQFGLKTKIFGKVFVWDYIERVSQNALDMAEDVDVDGYRDAIESFVPLVVQVNNSQSIGKDEKFKILMCLGLRDKLLSEWFGLLSVSPVTRQMYDSFSFWLDPGLSSFLPDVLQALTGFQITIDPSITRGLQ